MSDDLDELTKAEQRGYANAMEAERKLHEDRIEQLERERDEQEAKIDALTSGDWSKARLVRFENGQFDFSGGPVAFIAEYLAQCMEAAGGYHNNMEVKVDHPKAGPMFVTLQRIHGKTPAQQRKEAESKLAKAVEALRSCVTILNATIEESGRSIEWGEEDPFRMGEWFDDDMVSILSVRAVLAELEK